MATHCSVFAWRIPGMAGPGGPSSMGSHRVGHDWSDLAAAAAAIRWGFPGGASGKESACQSRRFKRRGFDSWRGRSPGGGHGNPLQYSCLENHHGQRSLMGYRPWGLKELDTTEQFSMHTCSIRLGVRVSTDTIFFFLLEGVNTDIQSICFVLASLTIGCV